MSSDLVIKVEKLSKCFQVYKHPSDRLKQFILPRIQKYLLNSSTQYFQEFWALRDASFEVKKGETVGIIGRNGSGKSTLLQMICGTLSPTDGAIEVYGRIGALLELGSGFNPDFSGRDNVYMNATLLGLSRDEIDARFDDIAAFADIGKFIEQPVKTYSSGMMVRLAFAVQAQIEPDILIVDEALAVGDARFQVKCFERLKQLKNNGTSILLVTHSAEQIVAHCSEAILIDRGSIVKIGEPKQVVNLYLDLLFGKRDAVAALKEDNNHFELAINSSAYRLNCVDDIYSTHDNYNPHEYRWGDGRAKLTDFFIESDGIPYPLSVRVGKKITFEVAIKFYEPLVWPIFGITIKTKEGITVYGTNTDMLGIEDFRIKGSANVSVIVKGVFDGILAPGDYFVSIGIASRDGEEVIPHDRRYDSIHLHIEPSENFFGLVDLGMTLQV